MLLKDFIPVKDSKFFPALKNLVHIVASEARLNRIFFSSVPSNMRNSWVKVKAQ